MLTAALLGSLALTMMQDPPLAVAPAERSEAQAALDVCLYTPAENRDPACQPLLEAEAVLVPDEAFAVSRPTALGWADVACTPDRLADQTRTACRDEQRGLFRRAERARQALSHGSAGGVYAEAWSRPPAASAGTGAGSQALSFYRDERTTGDACERRSTAWRDEDSGESSSSYSIGCSWTNGEGDTGAARQVLDALRDD